MQPVLDPAASAPMLQMLSFTLGAERHALRIDAVREILEVSQTTPLPLVPDFVHGVMNLRGAVVPVIDLGLRLDLARATASRRSCVVIVEAPIGADGAAQRVGLLVDAVSEVFDIAVEALEPVPRLGTRIDPAYIRAMARHRGQSIPELNLDTVLDAQALLQAIGEVAVAA